MVSDITNSFAMDTMDKRDRVPHIIVGTIGIIASIGIAILGMPMVCSFTMAAFSATILFGGAIGSKGFVITGYIFALAMMIAVPVPQYTDLYHGAIKHS